MTQKHVRYDRNHHAGATPEARISNRLRNSGGDHADSTVKLGTGPTRVFHNQHSSANHLKPRDVRDTNIRDAARKP
jgi:hypothetical protein